MHGYPKPCTVIIKNVEQHGLVVEHRDLESSQEPYVFLTDGLNAWARVILGVFLDTRQVPILDCDMQHFMWIATINLTDGRLQWKFRANSSRSIPQC